MDDKVKLALRVNELFHDLEGKAYQNKHADIFSGEMKRWQTAAEKVLSSCKSPFTVMDIGTGTGFIPLNIAQFLSEKETFICSDISMNMLEVSKLNINDRHFKCRFEYLKLNGEELPALSERLSVVTMNSVVHHVPDLCSFFTQLDQLLEPGGRIMIGHEPNKAFYRTKFLFNFYLFLRSFSSLKELVIATVRFTRLNKLFSGKKTKSDPGVKEINRCLKHENRITRDLSKDEINKLIDFHSPTAGAKPDLNKGIDIEEIKEKYLKNYRTEHFETYNFIGKMSERNAMTKRLNRFFSGRFKQKGAHFFAILIKEKHAD